MKAFITYEGLPLNSGGAHQLVAKPPSEVYALILNFLQLYTDTKGADRVAVQLVDFSFRNIIKYSLRFGLPSFDWSSYLANGMKDISWNVYLRKIEYYVDQIVNHQELGLSVYWRFNFIDPQTKMVLPGQSELPVLDVRLENSRVYLRLPGLFYGGLKNGSNRSVIKALRSNGTQALKEKTTTCIMCLVFMS